MPKPGKQPSVMKHQFAVVPHADIPRSTFDRSHGHKTTFDGGLLIPYFVDEVLPGDTFSVRSTLFARLATPIFPVMDNLMMDTQFFAVPIRLIWDNWEKFNGAQDNPGDSTDFLIPQMTANVGVVGGLSDYFGIPPGQSLGHSSLWHRAHNLIWNDWYRDENLQDALPVPKGDGPDTITDFTVQRRGKRHDYFTACLPFPQKGESVTIPLGERADVIHHEVAADVDREVITNEAVMNLQAGTPGAGLAIDVFADLTTATSATINELRQSFQVQKMFERDARGGSRYTETIKAHFGVSSPDARLQRSEYLGGGSSPITFTPVAQTSQTDPSGQDASPQANLAAFATGTAFDHGFTKSFTEHCVLIGFVSIRADLSYQQGLNRMFSRETRFDYYWPALSHIGEQAVLNKEIFADGSATDELVFGYQERHAEYRYKPSQISGLFRSSAAETLDSWHLAQDFATLPVLDSDFIEDTPPIDRIIAVTDEPHFIFDSYTKMSCARPMPMYGVPGLIDHF